MYPPDGYTALVVRKNKGSRKQSFRKSRRHGLGGQVVEFMPADFGPRARAAFLEFAGRMISLRSKRQERWRRLLVLCRLLDELDVVSLRLASISRLIERANENKQPGLSALAERVMARAGRLINRARAHRRFLEIS